MYRLKMFCVALSFTLSAPLVHLFAAHAELTACSTDDEALWKTGQTSLGIFAVDDGRKIGGAVDVVKFDPKGALFWLNPLVGGYYPVSGSKQMTCGSLQQWQVYKLGSLERDLHAFIAPVDPYKFILSELPAFAKQECEGCIWGEVTVPGGFEPFWSSGASKPLDEAGNPCGSSPGLHCVGETAQFIHGSFCMYGPWIMEKAHSFHPEVHPVQMFWGQKKDAAGMYFLLDDSKRFDDDNDYDQKYLSETFAPWGRKLSATVYQLVRAADGKPATLKWDDDTAVLGASESGASDPPSDGLTVTHPLWIHPHVVKTCATADGRLQHLVQATVALDKQTRWRGLNISGDNVGVTYANPHLGDIAPVASMRTDVDSQWEARFSTEWSQPVQPAGVKFSANKSEWGLADQKSWLAIPRQRMVAQVSVLTQKAPVPDGITSRWTVHVVDLDHPAEAHPTGGFTIALDFDRKAGVQVDSNVPVRRNDTTHKGQYALSVEFDSSPSASPQVYVIGNYKVTVTATLMKGDHTDTQTNELYSIVPDQLASLAGYDLRRQNGVYPERLARIVYKFVAGNGCNLTYAGFLADINGSGSPSKGLSTQVGIDTARLRLAAILRQTTNFFLNDRTLTNDELSELLRIAGLYQMSCAAQ